MRVVLVGVCALTFFVGLGRPALTDSDEAFYAESAREMIERRRLAHSPLQRRTPLRQAGAVLLARRGFVRRGRFVARCGDASPPRLAGVGLVLVTFFCALRWHDEPTALLAGLIAATSAGIVAMARQGPCPICPSPSS